MNGKLTLSGLKEFRLRLGAGSATLFARRARALFQRPEAVVTDGGSFVEFFPRVSLFEHLDHRDRMRLARIVDAREFADGESTLMCLAYRTNQRPLPADEQRGGGYGARHESRV